MISDPIYAVAVSSMALAKKIPPGDGMWSRFNASFSNRHLGQIDLAEAICTGHPITTHHSGAWRTSANYLCGQHLALDFDAEDDTSTLPRLSADKFIAKYAAIIHTTISHKPDAPRARVLFVIDTPIMQAKNYTLAAAALLWLFGNADRQCKDAARFFYGAPGCEWEMPGQVLPLEVVRKLIAEYQETGQRERRRQGTYTNTADQQEVADALRFIPAWGIPYDDWLAVLMGIHAAFGDAGLGLAEYWADEPTRQLERRWHSFNADGNPAGSVTVATVFGIAKRFGWRKAA